MSRKQKELTVFERGEIIGAWKCGLTERNIAEALEHSNACVHKIIFAYKNHGDKAALSRTGRPPKISVRDGRHLVRIIKKDRKLNLHEIHENFIDSTSTNVCEKTVSNYLHEQGFYGRVGIRKPLVTEVNRKKRLAWAKERKEWVDEWNNVIWSDESKFELFRGNGKRWVWRQPHEKYDIDCLIPTVKSGQQGIMVWGCFTKNGLGPLVRLEGKITAVVYINMLENFLLPYMDTLDNQENYIFQEDNAPIHTARVVKDWKSENDINSLPWPAQSPDLNPIEHLWDELERQVRAHKPLPKNREDLWQILQEEWSKINASKYQNLVSSLPRRVAAVIKNKGHPTKY